jgi:RHS repeat-associated protein
MVSQLSYNDVGQVIQKKLHSADNGTHFMQSMDYSYNERRWLVSVNNPYNLSDPGYPSGVYSNDLFAFKTLYNVHSGNESGMNLIQGSGFLPKFNGNISGMVWNSSGSSIKGYDFSYDYLNRLTGSWYGTYSSSWSASSTTAAYNETGISYDLNGNLKKISRNNTTAGAAIDMMTYGYDPLRGNRLDVVEDSAGATAGFDFSDNGTHLASSEYLYDADGNLIQDKNKGITISYNSINLPVSISWTDGRKIEFIYSAQGDKLRMSTYNASGTLTEVRDYVGGFQYVTNVLQFFSMSEGRVIPGSPCEYQYVMRDRLGNARVMFRPNTVSTPFAERLQEDTYYPFGLRVPLQVPGLGNNYLFNSKELIDKNNLSLFDYGFRFYDPQLGRWQTMDPIDGLVSPYVYAADNPVYFIDQFGLDADPPPPGPGDYIYTLPPIEVTANRIYTLPTIEVTATRLPGWLVFGFGAADATRKFADALTVGSILFAIPSEGVTLTLLPVSGGIWMGAQAVSGALSYVSYLRYGGSAGTVERKFLALGAAALAGGIAKGVAGKFIRESGVEVGPLFRWTQSGRFATNMAGWKIGMAEGTGDFLLGTAADHMIMDFEMGSDGLTTQTPLFFVPAMPDVTNVDVPRK